MISPPRPSERDPDAHLDARPDARAGTHVALGFPLLALGALAAWFAAGPAPTLEPNGWTLIVLPLICAAYGLLPVPVDARTFFTFEGPTVLLAGLVGGPLAGVLAGVGSGLGDVNAVWRRRSAYAGLAMLQGFAAGLAGEAWGAGHVPLAAAAAAAALAYLALSASGLSLVMLDRGSWNAGRLGRALGLDVVEVTVSAPLVYLLASTFASAPGVSSLAVLSGLAVAVFGAWGITTERALAERERRARLIDPLTGALTRAAFEEAFAREQARVLRGERRSGLIICDLDRFGELNARHGHLGGDQVLRSVVKRIEATLRPGSALSRWGGDELCVLVPGIGTLAELESLCERIRRSVGDDPLALAGVEVSVTISLGATLLADWTTWEQTFARADEALYLAKRTRDASCVLPPLAAGGGTATRELVGVA